MKKQVNNMKICKRKEDIFKQMVCLINFIRKKTYTEGI